MAENGLMTLSIPKANRKRLWARMPGPYTYCRLASPNNDRADLEAERRLQRAVSPKCLSFGSRQIYFGAFVISPPHQQRRLLQPES